ncbi:MAG: DNA-methyltransferase, partial [Candidatus Helarchaeota archaeon]
MRKNKNKQFILDFNNNNSISPPASHKILHGDVYASLSTLKDNYVDCAVTSPPYWGQRDYGFEKQIGNEENLEEYISKLVKIYNILRQKLKEKGIFFLNIGDKYINKYGNTPLGMIPYKLAYFMVQDGWILVDIIVWYKPNHMPSSVKNRFTNTYEPVFVFAKSNNNYYRSYRKRNRTSNILKVPLQPVPYAHMATYPEKLVEKLITLLDCPSDSLILDPFAGSGTTCKAVQNLNQANNTRMNSVLIEAQKDFVKIIKDRCNLGNEDIQEIEEHEYSYKLISFEEIKTKLKVKNKFDFIFDYHSESMIIYFIKNNSDYNEFFPALFDEEFIDSLNDDGVLFIGLPDHDIKKIFEISLATKWIIRNMIVIPKAEKNDWIPLFMLVKDTKMVRYKFDIDIIRQKQGVQVYEDWNNIDFKGYEVRRAANYFKKADEGLIVKILSKKENGLPHWVVVKWV